MGRHRKEVKTNDDLIDHCPDQKVCEVEECDDVKGLPSYVNHPVSALRALLYCPGEWTVDRYYPEVGLHLDIRYKDDKEILQKKSEIMEKAGLKYRYEIV